VVRLARPFCSRTDRRMETNPIRRSLDDLAQRCVSRSGGFFDYEGRSERLTEVLRNSRTGRLDATGAAAQELGRERTRLEAVVGTLDKLKTGLD